MTEFSESQRPNRYYCELLNAPDELFRDVATEISWLTPALIRYRDLEKANTPGLYKHMGAWVYLLRKNMAPMGPAAVTAAESAMNTGSLMTYGMLHKVAELTGQEMPNPPFDPSSIVDTEITPPTGMEDTWTLDFSRRGEELPKKFPAIFNANLLMLAYRSARSFDEIKELVFSKAKPTTLHWDTANFLAGAAEIVLPLERYAQVSALESNL